MAFEKLKLSSIDPLQDHLALVFEVTLTTALAFDESRENNYTTYFLASLANAGVREKKGTDQRCVQFADDTEKNVLAKPEPENVYSVLEQQALMVAADLTRRERLVLDERFTENETLKVIAKKLGISRERVRQIEGAALGKIRNIAARLESEGRSPLD